MNTTNTSNTMTDAERNAQAKVEHICALVDAMQVDFDELGRMRDDYAAAEGQDEPEFDDLREIEATLAACDLGGAADADDVYDAIQELPLSIEVRSGWHSIGEDLEAAEVRVVLTFGGPSCEIRADYDPSSGCSRPRVLWSEWGASGELVDFSREGVIQFLDYLLPV